MGNRIFAALLSVAAITLGGGWNEVTAAPKPLKVFILAGQSNMEGHAHIRTFEHIGMDPATQPMLKDMTNDDGSPVVLDDVYVASVLDDKGTDKKGKLTAGFGSAKNGPKIGPEFTFGIYAHRMFKEPILIIKTAWGGKSLYGDFRPPSGASADQPTGPYYKLMKSYVKQVLGDLKSAHPAYDSKAGYELAGFVWFQGWNDMVNSKVYPNRGKPDGYKMYSTLLTHFIRDVRKDFDAPKMPFVIGVMGTGGILDLENPGRYTAIHHGFRVAMAAPAALPEFKGNVVAVQTGESWDPILGEIADRGDKLKAKSRELNKNTSLSKTQRTEQLEAFKAKLFTPEELKIKEVGISNFGFHYLGSGKVFARIGKSFAEAAYELNK